MSFDVDLSAVEEYGDIQLEDAAEYKDQTGPAPLHSGDYRVRILEGGLKKDKEGNLVKDENYPILKVDRVEVVAPEEFAGRQFFPFQDYSLKPITNGNRAGSVPAVDLLRGFDDTATYQNGKEVIALIAEKITGGATLVVGTGWVAKDSAYIKDQLDEVGGFDKLDAAAKKTLFNKAIIRGEKKFPLVNGARVPEIEGPSGETLTARVNIARIYPASKEPKKLGVYGAK